MKCWNGSSSKPWDFNGCYVVLTVIIPCGIEYESLWRPREGTIKENDPGDVPNSVAWFGSNFETPFSRSVALTLWHTLLQYRWFIWISFSIWFRWIDGLFKSKRETIQLTNSCFLYLLCYWIISKPQISIDTFKYCFSICFSNAIWKNVLSLTKLEVKLRRNRVLARVFDYYSIDSFESR